MSNKGNPGVYRKFKNPWWDPIHVVLPSDFTNKANGNG